MSSLLPPRRSEPDRPTRRLRGVARALAAVLLLLQAVGGVVLPVLDAAGPHEAAVVAHWDGESDRHCPPQHTDADCLVVKSLTASALPVTGGQVIVGSTTAREERRPAAAGLTLASADRRIPPATGPPKA